MVEAGQLALVIAFVVSLYVPVASFVGSWQKAPELTTSGRYGFYTIPLLLLISTAALVYAFVGRDFSVRYVFENSNLAMPQIYTWVAFYAGNAGSLLFLAITLSTVSVIAVLTIRKRLPYTAPYATGIMALVIAFFLGIMVFMANPLEVLDFVPLDGRGINPLLIHFGMFIHPPLQMAGLVLVAIPFSIAIGALAARRGGRDEWVDMGRLWGMISWLVLTMGLLLGSWWAYTILGWGGYWAWDPVENSALMPWLAMTAFVHSIMVQKRRGMFRMWNMVLIIIGFTLAQMGMFINRGGPVPSVHSFAQSAMGWLFLMFMAVTLIAAIAVFFWRLESLKSRASLESPLSRESAFLGQNILFLAVAFVTLWGTLFPIFSEAAQGTVITVGRPFFDKVNGPLLLALVFLMGVGPLLPWRRATVRNLLRSLRVPFIAALATAVILVVLGVRQVPAVVAFATVALVLGGIANEWVRGTRSRHRKGEAYHTAFANLLSGNRPRYGGYIVHLGILMLTVGAIASSFYGVQRDLVMRPGETATIGNYSFEYLGVENNVYADREEAIASFDVYHNGKSVGVMSAYRAFYPDFRIAATKGAIRSTLVEDFYIVPSEFEDGGQAVFRVLINPLVWWMWASGPIIALGIGFGLWPARQPAVATVRLPAGVQAARA
ncbi:MAG: heme lyase CcmF/NrfE family subunit [Chloroflexi bacterium]|nr:heme lyase CcmF/NrfE family subunit [Chloroflexota bacterium]MCH9038828.1 heme lyase CcmF/NrfE family subunit [Chloroflexota bacterium]MCI0790305.1 heme lyase CcmF/NrfE family subunit [Chloroflexota bacterium]MCI0868123.1 heme lyase CcmF/NrfE family subunit [Chloroflexota bacterium]